MQGPCFPRAFLDTRCPRPYGAPRMRWGRGGVGPSPVDVGLCLGRRMIGIRAIEILALAGPVRVGLVRRRPTHMGPVHMRPVHMDPVRVGKASAR